MNYSELVTTVLTRHTENYLAKSTELQLILYHPRNHYAEIAGKPIPEARYKPVIYQIAS